MTDTTLIERVWIDNLHPSDPRVYKVQPNHALTTVDEYVPATALEAAQARIAELEEHISILRAQRSGAVYVCPECDIAGCRHARAALQPEHKEGNLWLR